MMPKPANPDPILNLKKQFSLAYPISDEVAEIDTQFQTSRNILNYNQASTYKSYNICHILPFLNILKSEMMIHNRNGGAN